MDKQGIMASLLDPGVIVIIRADGSVGLKEAVLALYSGGIKAVEISLTTPGALEVVAALRRDRPPGCALGVGTVLTGQTVTESVAAGAEFVVSPVFSEATVRACRGADCPILCGAYTPTEAYDAHVAGADLIKLFPANGLGPDYIRALRAPLPMLSLVPTGGVTLDNCASYFHAGAAAVAVGRSVVSGALIQASNWTCISSRAADYVYAATRARKDV